MLSKTKLPLSLVLCLFLSILLTGCSNIGLLNEGNSWLPVDILSFTDFLKVYVTLQISIFIISFIVSLFLGNMGYLLVLLLHFLWIVNYRDYGFLKVLLLFSFFTVVTMVFRALLKVIFDK